MKYNININQKALAKYEELDLKDCAIAVYCRDMCSSVNEKIENARYKGHTWINYERLIEDMPLLRIKHRNSITPRIKKLADTGLFSIEKKMIKGHRRVFVKPTTLLDSVFVESTERGHSDLKRVRETVQDTYTIDYNTKDTKGEEVKERFDTFRKLYKTKLKGKARGLDTEYNNFKRKYPSLNNVDSIREIETLLGKYYKELSDQVSSGKEDAFNYVPNFSTYINQARWEHYQD